MKKVIVVGSVLVAIFVVVLTLVLAVIKAMAFFGQPIELNEKLAEQSFDLSMTLQNKSNQVVSIGTLELMPNSLIEMRSLSTTLFIGWQGVTRAGVTMKPSARLALENSAYGKYSIPIDQTNWKRLLEAQAADKGCDQYAFSWFSSIADNGVSIIVRDEDRGNFYQAAYYSPEQTNSIYDLELEENFRRYSSRGSNFYYRYHCESTGIADRLGQYLRLVDDLTQIN